MVTEQRDAPLIGSAEAATILGVDRATLSRWVARGRVIPIHRLPGPNGAYVFSRTEIASLAARRIASREGAA